MKVVLLAMMLLVATSLFAQSNQKDFLYYCENVNSLPRSEQAMVDAILDNTELENCSEAFEDLKYKPIYLKLPIFVWEWEKEVSFKPIVGLKNIVYIHAGEFELKDTVLLKDSISNLEVLDLYKTRLPNNRFDFLNDQTLLYSIHMNGVQVENLDVLKNAHAKNIISLENMEIRSLDFLQNGELLQELILENNVIQDASHLREILNRNELPHLKRLWLANSQIEDISGTNFQNIEELDLSNNPLGNSGLAGVKFGSVGEHIWLENVGITNVDFLDKGGSRLVNWRSLNLSNNPITNIEGLRSQSNWEIHSISLAGTQVKSLEPVKGIFNEWLEVLRTPMSRGEVPINEETCPIIFDYNSGGLYGVCGLLREIYDSRE